MKMNMKAEAAMRTLTLAKSGISLLSIPTLCKERNQNSENTVNYRQITPN